DSSVHRADQLSDPREPLRGAGLDLGTRRAEIDLQIQRLLERSRMRETLGLEACRDLRELSFVAGEQVLELIRLRACFGVLLLGLEAPGALVLETIADPAAERRADDEPDRAARGRTDHGAAAETDRLVLRGT